MAGDASRFSAGVPGFFYNVVDFHNREIIAALIPLKLYDVTENFTIDCFFMPRYH